MMATLDTARKIVAVPPRHMTFVHQVIVPVGPRVKVQAEGDVVQAYIATCTTNHPATRCECAMFDIGWNV